MENLKETDEKVYKHLNNYERDEIALMLSEGYTKKGIAFQPLASNGEFGGIYVPKLDADFLDADEGNAPLNHYILKTAVSTQIGGVTFPIINNAVLTIMKFIIGRDKDTSDAFKLLKTVPKEELKTHLKNLKSYLPEDMDAKTIWSYAKAIGM